MKRVFTVCILFINLFICVAQDVRPQVLVENKDITLEVSELKIDVEVFGLLRLMLF